MPNWLTGGTRPNCSRGGRELRMIVAMIALNAELSGCAQQREGDSESSSKRSVAELAAFLHGALAARQQQQQLQQQQQQIESSITNIMAQQGIEVLQIFIWKQFSHPAQTARRAAREDNRRAGQLTPAGHALTGHSVSNPTVDNFMERSSARAAK